MPKFYLTTAIDYSNGDPHLGHALEKVGADCIARYRRLRGDDVHFLMGMDEHSQAVLQAAEQNGLDAAGLGGPDGGDVRGVLAAPRVQQRRLDPHHRAAAPPGHVTALLEQIARTNPDDLFVGEYEGLYCFGCEEFKQPSQIVNGHCIEHPTLELVPTRERNHFFRLSRYRDRLLSLIRSGEFRVEPAIRRNEIVRLLEDGLQDISVSRNRQSWGIPFPGDPEQTVYVWFDALINYLSATGYPDAGLRAALARRPARGRQGHHPVPLRHLAGDAAERGRRPAPRGLGPRIRAVGRHQDVEVGRHGREPGRGDRPPRPRRACATSCSARSASRPTATSPGIGSTSATPRTWRTGWATSRPGRWRCWPSTGTASCRLPPSRHHARRGRPAGGRRVRRARWTRWTSAAARRRRGSWSRRRTCTSSRSAPWALAKAGREAELDAALAALARALYRLAVLASPFIPGKAQCSGNPSGSRGRA